MTKIEWTRSDDGTPGVTWNPTTGCDRVSPGCDSCYALTLAKRLKGMGSAKYQHDGDPRTSGPGFGLTVHPDSLDAPLRWRKPRRCFVNSMSDLFHQDVPDEFIVRVFAVMALAPKHQFQILTKRHGRMRALLNSERFRDSLVGAIWEHFPDWEPGHLSPIEIREGWWPLSNVHLGVSVEDQKRAELRIPALLETPAAVRFISAEPLLEEVDLRPWMTWTPIDGGPNEPTIRGLHWVICGGESGAGARRMDPDWVRTLIVQCCDTEIACFVKQLGSVWADENGWGGKGGLPEQWPADLRVREFPAVAS